jgi:hypothetical protein
MRVLMTVPHFVQSVKENKNIMARPKSSEVTWNRIFHNIAGEAFQAAEDPMFFRVKIKRYNKNKFFYGETAHTDYQRYMYDETLAYDKYGMP